MTGNAPSLISGYIILEQLNGLRLHRPDSLRHNAAWLALSIKPQPMAANDIQRCFTFKHRDTLPNSRHCFSATLPWATCQKTGATPVRGCETPWKLTHSHLIATTRRRFEFATSCRGSESLRNARRNWKCGTVAALRECLVVCKPTQVSQQIIIHRVKLCFPLRPRQ